MPDNSKMHKAFEGLWTKEDQATKDRRYAIKSQQEDVATRQRPSSREEHELEEKRRRQSIESQML